MALGTSSKTAIRHSSCLCSMIRYQVTGDPLTFYICICDKCKKATGGPFMMSAFFRRCMFIWFVSHSQ